MVAPVAVGADPDLEERRLVFLHAPVPGRGERANARPRPDEREPERQVDELLPTRPLAVHERLPERRRLALLHPRPQLAADMLHRGGANVVREADPLQLLIRLDRTGRVEHRHRVRCARPGVEPRLRERRRLSDHPVGRLRAEGQLEADAPAVARGRVERRLECACRHRPRIVGRVALDEPHVVRPGTLRRVLLRRLDRDQHRLALAREDTRVVALHPPEVRQVENVVGRADDECVEVVLGHQRADAVELCVVARPGHASPQGRIRGGAGVPCQAPMSSLSTYLSGFAAAKCKHLHALWSNFTLAPYESVYANTSPPPPPMYPQPQQQYPQMMQQPQVTYIQQQYPAQPYVQQTYGQPVAVVNIVNSAPPRQSITALGASVRRCQDSRNQ